MTPPPTILSEQEIISAGEAAGLNVDSPALQKCLRVFTGALESKVITAYAAKLAQGVELEALAFKFINANSATGWAVLALDSKKFGELPHGAKLIPLPTAQAAVAAERLKHMQPFKVLAVTTAYEQGFGQALRDELSNPYRPGTDEREAWDLGRSCGKAKHAPSPAPAAEPAPNGFANALSIRAANGWGLNGGTVPVLYTDEINGQQVGRDDVWLCTTEALMSSTPSPQPAPAVPADRAGLVEECKLRVRAVRDESWHSAHGAQGVNVGQKLGEAFAAIDRLASSAAQVPEGWQLVPKVPTQAMCAAAVVFANGNAVYKNVTAEVLKIEEGIYGEAYAAMLAAAPAAGGEHG